MEKEFDYLVVKKMIAIYCSNKHNSKNDICENCNELLEYSKTKLDKCPYKINKPSCSACRIKCYQDQYQEEIKKIMRYSSGKMLLKHPILSLKYFVKKIRK